MNMLLSDWIGKKVHVTLHTASPSFLEGKLVNADASGVMLEMLKGQTSVQKYVPLAAILHINLI